MQLVNSKLHVHVYTHMYMYIKYKQLNKIIIIIILKCIYMFVCKQVHENVHVALIPIVPHQFNLLSILILAEVTCICQLTVKGMLYMRAHYMYVHLAAVHISD